MADFPPGTITGPIPAPSGEILRNLGEKEALAGGGGLLSGMSGLRDLSELVYQRLMTCYWRLGDKTAAASNYARLRKILKSQLDIAPSSDTEVLYQRIMAEP